MRVRMVPTWWAYYEGGMKACEPKVAQAFNQSARLPRPDWPGSAPSLHLLSERLWASATFVSLSFLIKVYHRLLCIGLWGWNEAAHTKTQSFSLRWLLPTRTVWTLKRNNRLLCARPHSKHSTSSFYLHSSLAGNITSNPILQMRKLEPRKVEKYSTSPKWATDKAHCLWTLLCLFGNCR